MLRSRTIPAHRVEQLSLPERIDVDLIETLRPWLQTPAVQSIGKIGNLGDEPPLLALSVVLLTTGTLLRKPPLRRAGIRMVAAHLIAIALKEWGKNHIDRSRPDEQLKKGSYHMAMGHSCDPDLRSFPSGHTAGALAVARAFSREYPRYSKLALAAAAVIGALQVPRRAHYPGDVIAGALTGMVAEKLAAIIIDRLRLSTGTSNRSRLR